MKLCSHCGANYNDHVDFCFSDGSPLRAASAAEAAEVANSQPSEPSEPLVDADLSALDAPDPQHLRFDEVPEPRFLQGMHKVSAPSPPPPTPLGDTPTDPVPLDQSAPFDGDGVVAKAAAPLPSSQDTEPIETPPLQRGQDWDDQAHPTATGFGTYNPAETSAFMPSVGQEPFGVGQEPFGGGHVPQLPDPELTPPTSDDPVEDGDLDDSMSLNRATFLGGVGPHTEPPPTSGGLVMALGALAVFIVVGGGGFVLWNNTRTPTPEAVVENTIPDPGEKAPPAEAIRTPEQPRVPDREEVIAVQPPEPTSVIAWTEDTPTPPLPRPQDSEPTVASLGSETSAPEPPTSALLSISTDPPGASVWIDDSPAGRAPVAREVSLGAHNVKAVLEGYVTQTVRISVSDGSGGDARIPLKRKVSAEVNVTLYGQPNSKIFVDGNLVGSLPVSTSLKAGTHRFKVVTPNGVAYEVTRDIGPGTQSLSLLPD